MTSSLETEPAGNEHRFWHWVDRDVLLALHDESLAEHGGGIGLRDAGLLESALARAEHLLLYGKPDYAQLAAAYGFGLAKNHAFIDGNKRVAFLAMGLFLYSNGYRLTATQANATDTVLALAAGDVSEAAFADWIRANSVNNSASV
jgi:death on curing protein